MFNTLHKVITCFSDSDSDYGYVAWDIVLPKFEDMVACKFTCGFG